VSRAIDLVHAVGAEGGEDLACPTCRRRVHHGRDGAEYNGEIIQRRAQIEPLADRSEGATPIVWTLVFRAE
jgi:hypothetical protein